MQDLVKDKRLKHFIEVAEQGSLSRAAKALFVTQSALSQQMMSLEQDLGFQLLERGHRGVRLTKAGQIMYKELGRIIGELDQLVEQVTREVQGEENELTVGLRVDSDSRIINKVTPLFHEQYPGVRISLKSFEGARRMDEMLADDFNLIELPFSPAALVGEAVFTPFIMDDYGLCVPEGHRLARCEEISEEDLEGESIVVFPPGHLGDCDELREYLSSRLKEIHFINRYYNSLVVTECEMNGWLLAAPLCYAFRYEPLIAHKLSWPIKTRVGIVHRKTPTPLEKAYLLTAEKYFRSINGREEEREVF